VRAWSFAFESGFLKYFISAIQPLANSVLAVLEDPMLNLFRLVGTITLVSGVPSTPFTADRALLVAYAPDIFTNDPFVLFCDIVAV